MKTKRRKHRQFPPPQHDQPNKAMAGAGSVTNKAYVVARNNRMRRKAL